MKTAKQKRKKEKTMATTHHSLNVKTHNGVQGLVGLEVFSRDGEQNVVALSDVEEAPR